MILTEDGSTRWQPGLKDSNRIETNTDERRGTGTNARSPIKQDFNRRRLKKIAAWAYNRDVKKRVPKTRMRNIRVY